MENPSLISIPEGDCASCHVATPYRLAGEKRGPKATGSNGFVPAAGITATMEKDIELSMGERLYVVLNFAYVFEKPSISQRTVNEAAEVARFLNVNFVK